MPHPCQGERIGLSGASSTAFCHKCLSQSLNVAVREHPSGAQCQSRDEGGKSNTRDSWCDPSLCMVVPRSTRCLSYCMGFYHKFLMSKWYTRWAVPKGGEQGMEIYFVGSPSQFLLYLMLNIDLPSAIPCLYSFDFLLSRNSL